MFGFALSKAWAYLALSRYTALSQSLPFLNFETSSAIAAMSIALIALKVTPAKVKSKLPLITVGVLITAAITLFAASVFPEMRPLLNTAGNLLTAMGVMGLAALWTDLYALLNPIRATFFASGSVILSWLVCFALESNPTERLSLLLCVIALLAWGSYRKSTQAVANELHQEDDRRCRPIIPYRAVLFIASYSLAYGLMSGIVTLSGPGTSEPRTLPAMLVLIILLAGAKRFNVRMLYNIAFPTMAGGILIVALLPGVPMGISAPLINFSYGAMSLMVTVVACTISYTANSSVLWVFGLFVAVQYTSKLLGELLHQTIAALFWSGGADGVTALVAIIFVAVASIVMLTEKSAFSQWGANIHANGDNEETDGYPMAGVRARIEDLSQAYQLTQREIEVLHLMAEGKTNHGIAQDMFIAESTVKVHVRHIYQKLDVHSRKELTRLLGVPDSTGNKYEK